MMSREEIIAWLEALPPKTLIGIDDGGLALREYAPPDNDLAYLEVGGLPESVAE